MAALYVTSVEPYSGKTAIALGLAKLLQAKGKRVGYLKPLSTQPWRRADGQMVDEDTDFVRRTLGLGPDLVPESPVIVTSGVLRHRLDSVDEGDLLDQVKLAAGAVRPRVDLLILEGGGSLREGFAMGLSNFRLAESLDAPALVLVRCHREMQIADDALAAKARLGDHLLGVVFNHAPEEMQEFLNETARPSLEGRGIQVFGSLPRRPRLSALSLGELRELLGAEVITKGFDPDALVETFTIGAMTAEAALSRFRRQPNKAVITGGDRADIQLAALETSTVALILTGNLQPSPMVVQQAESQEIPILLVPSNTMEAVDRIEQAYSRTRLGQPEKLEAFLALMRAHVDSEGLFAALGLA
ncbi:MAG: phosphotransacetylase family protein [Anaerolineales bacterium]